MIINNKLERGNIMKIIGITGKSGSGKTTFASLLSQKLNCIHIDIDKIGHEAVYRPEILDILFEKFGTEILDKSGFLDRKKLGNIVFSQKNKMNELTDITWGYMQQKLNQMLSQNNNIFILEWILLPQCKYWEMCNFKILIKSDDTLRKNKIITRDNISEEYFKKRDSSSIDYSNIHFDYIFENDYQEQTLNHIIDKLSKQYLNLLHK